MCAAKRHVRFTPNSDRKSGFPHMLWAKSGHSLGQRRRWCEQPDTIYLVAQTMKELPSQGGNHCHQRYQQQNLQ
jgi:hypothetical protein